MSAPILFNQPSRLSLLALINHLNHQAFTVDQLQFADPVAGPTAGITTVTITPSDDSGLTGARDFTYPRLDLATFFQGAIPKLFIEGVITTQAVLDALLDQYQIYSSADPHDSFTVTLGGDGVSCTVAASPTSYVWTGSVNFAIDQRPLLASQLSVTTLDGFTLPDGQSASRPNAQVFYGLVDGQAVVEQCALLNTGDTFPLYATSWDLGKALTGDDWYANPAPGNFNVYGAKVTYNGPAVGEYAVPTSAGPYSGNVLVVNLGPACLNRCGALVVLYQPVNASPLSPPLPETAPDGNLLYN